MPIRLRYRDKPTSGTKPTGYRGFSAPLGIAQMAYYADIQDSASHVEQSNDC